MPDRMAKARAARKSIGYSAAKRRLADKFVRSLMHDFEANGDRILAQVREASPDVYLRLCAQLIPQTLEIETAEPLSLEAAIIEATNFLINLPEENYQVLMEAVQAERQALIPESPALEHSEIH